MDPTSSNVASTYGDHDDIAFFVLDFGYLAAFSNAGSSSLSDVENDAEFRTCLPLMKIRGEVGEISVLIVKALFTTKPLEYIRWSSTKLSAVD